MSTITIGWLNKCRCGNKSHTVKTARGNETALWDDDTVKCNSCGRGGVIQVCEGQARVLWETDEEMAENKPMSTISKEFTKEQLQQIIETDHVQCGEASSLARIALASLEAEAVAFNPAILDVASERQRQMSIEGWTSEHDDAYQNSELADAAACYAINAHNQGFSTPAHWPWDPEWWKQSGARRDLVKAGALILAEIERIDRAAKGEK
ncbi:hypothetical protein ACKJU6_004746 [Enterobacter asburiae]|nr:hypothetical protein [Enterobacter asburiae]